MNMELVVKIAPKGKIYHDRTAGEWATQTVVRGIRIRLLLGKDEALAATLDMEARRLIRLRYTPRAAQLYIDGKK